MKILFPIAKQEALEEISDLIMAAQGFGETSLRLCVESLCERLSGETPTREQLRDFIDADM